MLSFVLSLLTSNIVNTLCSASRFILIAKNTTPIEFGQFAFFSMLLSYLNYMDFGINNGFHYRSSHLKGQGKISELNNINKSVLGATVWLSIIGFAISISAYFFFYDLLFKHNSFFLVCAFATPLYLLQNYYIVLSRVRGNFHRISVSSALGSIVALIFSYCVLKSGYSEYNVEFLLFSGVSASIVTICILSFKNIQKIDLQVNKLLIWDVFKIGFALTIYPILVVLTQSVDKWLLFDNVSSVEFGFYTFGTTLGAMIALLPNTLGVIFSSELIQSVASSNQQSIKSRVLATSVYYCAWIISFIVGLFHIIGPFLINEFFEKYKAGYGIIGVVFLSYSLLFPLPMFSSYMIAIKRSRMLIMIMLFYLIVESLAIMIALHNGGAYSTATALLRINLAMSVLLTYILIRYNSNNNSILECFFVYGGFVIFFPLGYFLHKSNNGVMISLVTYSIVGVICFGINYGLRILKIKNANFL